jgi:hypothetical protein
MMPSVSAWSRRLAPFAAVWLLGAVLIVRTALLQREAIPGQEMHYAPDSWLSVVGVLVLMGVEMGAVAVLLLRGGGYRSPGRWGVTFGVMSVLTVVLAIPLMHANNALVLHILWLGLVDVLLLVGVLASAIIRAAKGTD